MPVRVTTTVLISLLLKHFTIKKGNGFLISGNEFPKQGSGHRTSEIGFPKHGKFARPLFSKSLIKKVMDFVFGLT